jgi:hypothetical protein
MPTRLATEVLALGRPQRNLPVLPPKLQLKDQLPFDPLKPKGGFHLPFFLLLQLSSL